MSLNVFLYFIVRLTGTTPQTIEEREEIVKYCIAHNKDYGLAAIKYHVSYGQVYYWVGQYLKFGKPGLEFRRGKRKASQEPRSHEEELEIQLEKVKQEKLLVEIELNLLKKAIELQKNHSRK